MAANEGSTPKSKLSEILPTSDELYKERGYVLRKEIGKGSFGKVYLAHLSPEMSGKKQFQATILALKEVKFGDVTSKKYERLLQACKKEAETMKKLTGHPYIVELYEEFTDSSDSSHFFSMEFADAGSLYDEVRKSPLKKGLSLQKVRRWFAQIVSAVNHMHTKGYVHRDLKLSNILLQWPKGQNRPRHRIVKLADFGSASRAVNHLDGSVKPSTNFCGTLCYMAPELLAIKVNSPAKKSFNPFPVDIWALGICLFIMVTRHYPFAVSNEKKVLVKALDMMNNSKYVFPREPEVPKRVKELIVSLLQPQVQARVAMAELFKSSWLNRPLRRVFEAMPNTKAAAAKSKLYFP